MNKSELILRLTEKLSNNMAVDLSDSEIETCIRLLIDSITQSLAKGRRVEVRDFGCFELRLRPARTGRNPKTGVSVKVPAKYTPHFKPGKALRERVDKNN